MSTNILVIVFTSRSRLKMGKVQPKLVGHESEQWEPQQEVQNATFALKL